MFLKRSESSVQPGETDMEWRNEFNVVECFFDDLIDDLNRSHKKTEKNNNKVLVV